MQVELTKLKSGKSARVVELKGGRNFILRLQNLGIRPGIKITKVGAHFLRGPITIQVGAADVALGFGMAAKIIVEADGK